MPSPRKGGALGLKPQQALQWFDIQIQAHQIPLALYGVQGPANSAKARDAHNLVNESRCPALIWPATPSFVPLPAVPPSPVPLRSPYGFVAKIPSLCGMTADFCRRCRQSRSLPLSRQVP